MMYIHNTRLFIRMSKEIINLYLRSKFFCSAIKGQGLVEGLPIALDVDVFVLEKLEGVGHVHEVVADVYLDAPGQRNGLRNKTGKGAVRDAHSVVTWRTS